MRKLKMHVAISLDGYAAASDGNLSWITYNEELAQRSRQMTADADIAMFGRVTYKGMQSYWPSVPNDPDSTPGELSHAKWLEGCTKIAVSTTMSQSEADWPTTVLFGADFAERLREIKKQPGGNIMSFGSPTLVNSCLAAGLVDDLYVNLIPVILGDGKLLFSPQERRPLVLVEAVPASGGVVALHYHPQ